MTWNPHDPNKPGGYTDWKLHGEKYGNYGSSAGQHGTSPISKPNAITPFSSSSPSYSSSSPSNRISSLASNVITGGRGYSAGGYSGSSGSIIGRFFRSIWDLAKTAAFIGAIYGAFDAFVYKSNINHSMETVLRTEVSLSDSLGRFIISFDPMSPWLALANKAQSEAGFALALCAMGGAAVGNGVVDLARHAMG